MTLLKSKKREVKELTTTWEVRDFFGGAIPESWEEARYQMNINYTKCSYEVYLSALAEQENP